MHKRSLHFVPAGPVDILRCSYGRVTSPQELYDPKIFGPEQDLKCSCGKYHGESMIGLVCDQCGVIVVANASKVRRERLGHVVLPGPCPHPLEESASISEFPVAPLGFRATAEGVNALGRKYPGTGRCRLRTSSIAAPIQSERWP